MDCDDVDEKETRNINNSGKTSLKINVDEGLVLKSGDSVKLKINSDGIKANGSEVQVRIDDENGVEIKSKNDN